MLSYKEIININKAFADAHHVIQNFEVGEVWQLTNHDEFESFKYPLMFMERQPASYSRGEFVYTFRIWFLTRVESPKSRGTDLLFSEYTTAISSMTNCAQNLISYWLQDTDYPDLEIDLSGSIEPETDVTPDKISGVSVIVNFRVNFSYDNCLIPMTGVPSPSDPCEDATYQNSDSSFTQSIASGGSYTAPDIELTVNSVSEGFFPANQDISVTVSTDLPIHYVRPPVLDCPSLGVNYDEKWHFDNGTFDYTIPSGTKAQELDPMNPDKLLFNNVWGHKFRFVGSTGGYYDGGNYYDVDGVLSDRDTEFLLSGSYYIIDEFTGLGWRGTRGGGATLTTQLASSPFTYSGFSDFYIPPMSFIEGLIRRDVAQPLYLTDRPPFDIQLNMWSCTPYAGSPLTNAFGMLTTAQVVQTSIGTAYVGCYVRAHY